jgi:extracellular elastinolytic metalloproteinase
MTLKLRPEHTRTSPFTMASFMSGKPQGIRRYPYTSDVKVNPLTYKDMLTAKSVHQTGEIWCTMLWEVLWNIMDANGFDWNLKRTRANHLNGEPLGGNVITLQDVIDGIKLQPCNPTFIQARDAVILADQTSNQGANVCSIWRGFAKRGLGKDAKADGIEDFSVPQECTQQRPTSL